ncbi:YybH family protein [Methylocucumis oryzae]|uniref:DUF4440 domain-containing protein n=1 Tax=Methylocucumis oryzae TaxID=1632867 RepID=A0A0F3IEK0_9GAMM|nr:nuclear transport factor 2 family protein [Methylocucumis oryzae]KJV04973.1 hypothetical protein VZ94_21555 [Methylocucumis oryzae]
MKLKAQTPKILQLAALATALLTLTAFHPGAHDTERSASTNPITDRPPATTAVGTVEAFHSALVRGDTQAALALLADDVLIFESGGVERSKAEYASHHLHADAEFSMAVKRTLESRSTVGSEMFAWVTSVEKVTGTFRNSTINSRSIETMLLTKSAAGWQISHIHWSSAKTLKKFR